MKQIASMLVLLSLSINSYSDSLTIQSTTSTRDSGLYEYLLPYYPDYNKIKIKVIAVGTGQAIMNARNCDGNILIVHDKEREIQFIDNGHGSKRHELMYNDFIIVGPSIDQAKIASSATVDDAFNRIYNSNQKFISRSET